MKKIIIILLAFISILSACRKKLDIEIPESEKNIVVNGIITPDSLIKINISKSQGALDNGDIPYLETATAKLYEDGTFIENLNHTTNGDFISTILPQINKEYKITVDYNDLKSVNAKMKLQDAVNIISIDTIINRTVEDYGGGYMSNNYKFYFKIKINDNANENNYYFLALTEERPQYAYGEDTTIFLGMEEENSYYNSNDPVLKNENTNFNLNGMDGRAFSDNIFNGKEYTININMSYWVDSYRPGSGNTSNTIEQTKVKIKLLSINRDIYNYIKSYNLNEETEYDPFAQPVQVYTNIENGLGLFSGYTMDVDSVSIDL